MVKVLNLVIEIKYPDDLKNIESEELLIRNTFLNSKITEIFCNN